MTPGSNALLALTILVAGCASPRQASWAEVQPPVAYIETLPPGALVTVDGAEVGLGPLAFPVPDEARSYAIRVTSEGFEPLDATFAGSKLAGARIELVLRPVGFGSQRQLASGEPSGLLQAAVALLRANRPKDAITYARASLAAGDSPQGHKVCGQAYRRLGNRDMAIKEYSLYLSLSPDAPDRKAIEEAITATASDIEMTAPRAPLD